MVCPNTVRLKPKPITRLAWLRTKVLATQRRVSLVALGEKNLNNCFMGEDTPATPSLTFGQKAVGLTFNPSGDEMVLKAKQLLADAIDLLNNLRGSERSEQARLCSVAITELQGAQMWAVKAITWKD